MRRLVALALASMLCSISAGAWATSITLDPGAVGSAQAEFTLPFSALNGTPLDGQPISVSFVFDDSKHVASPALPSTLYQAVLRLGTTPGQAISSAGGTGYLTDENGDPLFPAEDVITNGSDSLFAYFLRTSTANGLMHHGVNFDVSLPDIDNKVIESGWLELKLSPFSREPLLTVGDGDPPPTVPEPGSLLLLSLALAALALAISGRALRSQPIISRWPRQARACGDPMRICRAPR